MLVRAAVVAGTLSGVPSTAWAVLRGDDPLAATRAAGRLVLPRTESDLALVAAASAVHGALSVWWTAVLDRALPGSGLVARVIAGAAGGAAVALLDLGVAHRSTGERFAAVRALPLGPQVADHVAFGICVALGPRGPLGPRELR